MERGFFKYFKTCQSTPGVFTLKKKKECWVMVQLQTSYDIGLFARHCIDSFKHFLIISYL